MTGLPDFFTVPEAARVIRVGRTKAYAMAVEWRATDGRSGLPVVDFGHTLRVPRHALEQLAGAHLNDQTAGTDLDSGSGDIVDPSEPVCPTPPDAPPEPEQHTARSDRPSRKRPASSRRAPVRPSHQLEFFEPPPSAPRP